MDFEDLIGLFSFNTHNRGLIRMDLDEAVYLYKFIKHWTTVLSCIKSKYKTCRVIELGTCKAGTAILMAGAGAEVITIDNYSSKLFDEVNNPEERNKRLIGELGLGDNIEVIRGDTRTYPNEDMKCDILFIDGDHSFEGVQADFNHWHKTVAPEGHIIFHDAVVAREGATGRKEVELFLKSLDYRSDFVPMKEVARTGSLIHFQKIKVEDGDYTV